MADACEHACDKDRREAAAGHRETAETLIRESQKMQRQMEYLLVRARGATVEPTVPLCQTVKPIVTAMAGLHADRRTLCRSRSLNHFLIALTGVDASQDRSYQSIA